MAFYMKRPVTIEAITFDELVRHGIDSGADLIDGIPRAFDYKGFPITHEIDSRYIIPTLEGNFAFTPDDMLITGVNGEIYPCKIEIFNKTYDQVEQEETT